MTMKGRSFNFVHDEEASLNALARIAYDLANRKIVLGDIWDNRDKEKYLNTLEREGVLPVPSQTIEEGGSSAKESRRPKARPSGKVTPYVRVTLIPQKDFNLNWPGRLQRHHQIWEELQFHLDLRKHPNAISVLLRVLIELAVENYIKVEGVSIHENDKLALRLEKAGLDLQKKGKIGAKQIETIRKFKQGDKIISTDTLNRYVHSSNFAPSPEHLMSIWDSMADIIVLFLQE
ncbi:hypothetical protein FB480_103550 [Agrobacterium vitis]|nr:hypothetical protein FB480_103550 [Agrobacterium vitis]